MKLLLVEDEPPLMEELFGLRDIRLRLDCQRLQVQANHYVCGVLVSYLLSNALRYTPAQGEVEISATDHTLTFRNTGPPTEPAPAQLFQLLRKGQQEKSMSTGLGLAIVQEICKVRLWKISYSYTDGCHAFTVSF